MPAPKRPRAPDMFAQAAERRAAGQAPLPARMRPRPLAGAEAKGRLGMTGQPSILFIDEIHRFNKAQQDAVLPYVEDGTLTLIGATTENPSFEVTSALLSRCQTLTLNPLIEAEIRIIILRALKDRLKGIGALNVELAADATEHLITMSKGDARIALNALELAALNTPPHAQ